MLSKKLISELNKYNQKRLKIMEVLLGLDSKIITSEVIYDELGSDTDHRDIGGRMSSLSKVKIDDEPLFIPVGREDRRLRYVVNPKINKQKLLDTVREILKMREILMN